RRRRRPGTARPHAVRNLPVELSPGDLRGLEPAGAGSAFARPDPHPARRRAEGIGLRRRLRGMGTITSTLGRDDDADRATDIAPALAMRGRQTQKEATRGRVIDAARELFDTQGYQGTTIREIARHAGVSVGSVF